MTVAVGHDALALGALRDAHLEAPLPEGRRRVVACAPGDVDMWRAILDHRHPDPDRVFVRAEPGMTDRAVTWLALVPGYGARGPADRHGEGPPPPGVMRP